MTLKLITILVAALIACTESEIQPKESGVDDQPCAQLFPPLDTLISTHTNFTKTNYPSRIKVFQADTIDEGDIVMLGNSLTQQGGNWGSKLDLPNVKNRGISGDNTDGVMARLNEMICRKPSVVFIMIGTNDLWVNYNAEKVAQNIDSIGSILALALVDSRVIVQTIMPLELGHSRKDKLMDINESLKATDERPYELLDTFKHMANEAGDLPAEYTHDGVHLTPEGYDKWVELLVQQF